MTVVAILIQLGQCTFAISGYDSGYNHGCSDAKLSDPSERYINQPEKGPSFHSDAFMYSTRDKEINQEG